MNIKELEEKVAHLTLELIAMDKRLSLLEQNEELGGVYLDGVPSPIRQVLNDKKREKEQRGEE